LLPSQLYAVASSKLPFNVLAAGNGTVTPGLLASMRRRYLSSMRAKVPVDSRGARWMVDKALSNAWLLGHIALLMPEASGWGVLRAGWAGECMRGGVPPNSQPLVPHRSQYHPC
jgi:hypothetical protein